MDSKFIPDPDQREVIDFIGGDALVLAAPGCGKTDVLTYRVIKAHEDYGIPYEDMLCLTFTNRASREMQERVRLNIDEHTYGLFIGNLHRFCIRFLHENNLLKLDTSIIDEDDQTEIISDLGNIDAQSGRLATVVKRVEAHANAKSKEAMGFPPELVKFGSRPLPKLYNIEPQLVDAYIAFKADNNLIDYDDIINLAYKAMMRPDFKTLKMSNYRWVQVDETQDLNPLQFAIIDKLVDPESHTAVYLGDERQSIFSFIGASIGGLRKLKTNTKIFNFGTNYRSPKYLVDFINKYAEENLDIEDYALPEASNDLPNEGGLVLLETKDAYGHEEEELIAAQTRQINYNNPGQSIGILTRTNARIERIAKLLDQHQLEYLKLSNRDRFKMVDYKTVYSHLAVVADEYRGAEWSRILYQTKAVNKISEARDIVSKLRRAGLTVTDMMRDDDSSYLMEFAGSWVENTFVVFDTETTGLDVFEDDVIQIAAVKMNSRGIIPDSEFEVFIRSDKPLPMRLGNGMPNPMVEIYADADKMEFADAIRAFMEYAEGCIPVAHNADFDIHIILNNDRRLCGGDTIPPHSFDKYWDSLKIARLVDPDLRSHKLEALLQHYALPGVNSHNAIDDVHATANLLLFLRQKMQPLLGKQFDLLDEPEIARLRKRLTTRYKGYYQHTLDKLYSPEVSEENTLLSEIWWLYDNFVLDKYIKPIPKFEYMVELFRKVLVDPENEPYFMQQLLNHVYEMRTFSESDLYHNGVVKESVHLMTVHKAKGLQFDNVFVYGSHEFPNWMDYKEGSSRVDEACRLLYVAISRARQRLFLSYSHKCSRFISPALQAMCVKPTPQQIERILQLENVFKQ